MTLVYLQVYSVTPVFRRALKVLGACALTLNSLVSYAEWNTTLGNTMHYTDDVALFSVTRRLSLKDDPTQPIVDRPNQGGDFVYEPKAELAWDGENSFGAVNFELEAGGYVFLDQSKFSHGIYEAQISQAFATGTKVSLFYNFVPDLFLGQNIYIDVERNEQEEDESLSNHYWSVHIDQALSDSITVRLLGRYGLRVYNHPFEHRDTRFWTLGPHLEWEITPDVELLVGYHFEEGSVNQRQAFNFEDDVSYINQYASAELKVHLLQRLQLMLIFDYEKNDFNSPLLNDEHRGATEGVYQGELELQYALDHGMQLKLGWQHGERKLTTETQEIKNNNVWLGFEYAF